MFHLFETGFLSEGFAQKNITLVKPAQVAAIGIKETRDSADSFLNTFMSFCTNCRLARRMTHLSPLEQGSCAFVPQELSTWRGQITSYVGKFERAHKRRMLEESNVLSTRLDGFGKRFGSMREDIGLRKPE